LWLQYRRGGRRLRYRRGVRRLRLGVGALVGPVWQHAASDAAFAAPLLEVGRRADRRALLVGGGGAMHGNPDPLARPPYPEPLPLDDDMLTPTGYPPPLPTQQPTRPTAHTAHS